MNSSANQSILESDVRLYLTAKAWPKAHKRKSTTEKNQGAAMSQSSLELNLTEILWQEN